MNKNSKKRETILSPFPTRRRMEIFDFLANSIFFPAYLLGVQGLIEGMSKIIHLSGSAMIFLWALATIPLMTMVGGNPYWRMGFKKKKRAYTIAAALLVYMAIREVEQTALIFSLTTNLILIEFLLRRLQSNHKLLANILRFRVLLLTALLTLMVLVLGNILRDFQAIYTLLPLWLWKGCILSYLGGVTLFPLYLGIHDSWSAFVWKHRYDSPEKLRFVLGLIRNFLLVFLLIFFMVTQLDKYLVSVLGLTLMLLMSNPGDLISRQKSNLLNIFRSAHESRIHKLASYNTAPASVARVIFEKVKQFFKSNLQWVLFFTAWIIGGTVFPFYLYVEGIETNVLVLLGTGVLTSVTISVFSYISWLIQVRPRHIVIPFKTSKNNQDAELEVISNLITQSFVNQLKQVSLLLNLRQVENLSLRNNSGLAVFVSSEQDQELIEQVRSLGNIETLEMKIPFGSILSPILSNLVETVVRGTVQRQDDRKVAISIEYQKRGGQIVNVAMEFLPENSARDLDEAMIREITYALAVKLVFKLGQHSYMASSWESLRLFIDGINAAYHRNWWHAIDCYQKAIHFEEAARSNFGYGYYHLGAMLIFQGEILQGLKYLELAENVGPPLAETHYMLAVGRFYFNKEEIHRHRSIFADIIEGCQAALKLRPDFPEAYHLIGTAYYQRGRLRERSFTRFYEKTKDDSQRVDPVAQGYADDYHKARFYFQRSIRLYDSVIHNIYSDPIAQATFIDEKSRIIHDRMAAVHRLADTLRCLDRFAEADALYKEVLYAFPKNSRTMIDRAKTYCLAENWGLADQYLRTEIFNQPALRWNKSASFYMAWTLLGGLAEEQNLAIKITNKLIYAYERLGTRAPIPQTEKNVEILSDAVDWLDFAYHEYPGYTLRWRQLDWLSKFNSAIYGFERTCNCDKTPQNIYNSTIQFGGCYVQQLRYWLAWRINGLSYLEDKDITGIVKTLTGEGLAPDKFPFPVFENTYKALMEIRTKYYLQLMQDDSSRSIKSINRRVNCIQLGERGIWEWKKAKRIIKKIVDNENQNLNFGARWALDLFAELSLLTAKLLSEGKGYEYANFVARESALVLEKVFLLQDIKSNSLNLGVKVLQYQLASLLGWEAFSALEANVDVATKARIQANLTVRVSTMSDVQNSMEKAKKMVQFHPLVLYAEALNKKRLGLYRESADDLILLLQVISPNNPHKYLDNNIIRSNDHIPSKNDIVLVPDLTKRERINGRLQFDYHVNPVQIHLSLASIFAALKELNLTAEHLMLAIGHCPYNDLSAELFVDLTRIFNQNQNYKEALTASEEAKNRHQYLSPFSQSTIKKLEPFILESVLTTNLGDYSGALEKVEILKSRITIEKFCRDHQLLIQEVRNYEISTQSPILNKMIQRYEIDFKRFSEKHINNKINQIAELCLNVTVLAKYFSGTRVGYQKNLAGFVSGSQLVAMLSRDVFEFIVFECDIYNNAAFNWAELNINLSEAEKDAEKTVIAMQSLLKSIYQSKTVTQDVYTSIGKQLQQILDPLTRVTTSYDERLANYIDTLAWILFRIGGIRKLRKANDLLINFAILLAPGLPITHYHIARVCISKVELTIQTLPNKNLQRKKLSSEMIDAITRDLRSTSIHLRHANQMDGKNNFSTQIRLLQEKSNYYLSIWRDYHIGTIKK